jgi:hypothetical protein
MTGPSVVQYSEHSCLPDQRSKWLAERDAPTRALYVNNEVARWRGRVHIDALKVALQFVVDRHDALRTTFVFQDGLLKQRVASRMPVDFDVVACSPASVDDCVHSVAWAGFDLSAGPLFRARLFEVSPDEHVFLLSAHQIVFDGPSLGIVATEFRIAYEAAVRGQVPELPEPPISYAAYADERGERTARNGPDPRLEFWRRCLQDAPPVLKLPYDMARPGHRTFAGDSESFAVPTDAVGRLLGVARKEGATAFMALLAVYGAFLSECSGQADLVIGTYASGRTDPRLRGVVGLLSNTIPLRLSLGERPTFVQLIRHCRNVTLDGHANAEVPFDAIVERAPRVSEPGCPPVFQVRVAVTPSFWGIPKLPGLEAEHFPLGSGLSRFDLSLFCQLGQGELAATWEYNRALFAPSTISRFTAQFCALLDRVSRHPREPVSS